MSDEQIVLVERDGAVGVVLMNRPKQLNALSGELMGALVAALKELDLDPEIRCIVLGGNERAFAAGADIAELAAGTPISLYESRRGIDQWDVIRGLRTPLVAAVSGYCLGGGCELAMACDLIVASETATFGQPEINLGVLPGAGGTQRLTHAVGKSLAMDVILTGRFLRAAEALRAGLVARVVAREAWLEEAKRVGREIAAKSPIALRLAKEAVEQAFEAPLSVGIEYERRAFYLARASEDAGEGLNAFVEKRKPDFTGR
jgi:enoyl-CoA hydratase